MISWKIWQKAKTASYEIAPKARTDNCSITLQIKPLPHWQVASDCFLKIKISERGKMTCTKNINWKWRVWNMKPPQDLSNNLRNNLDNRGWLTHGLEGKKRGLSRRPYHTEERNLLLACCLFPGTEWKQFFQVKKRKAAVWKHKNNRAHFNSTRGSQLPTHICKIKEGKSQWIKAPRNKSLVL